MHIYRYTHTYTHTMAHTLTHYDIDIKVGGQNAKVGSLLPCRSQNKTQVV